MPTLEETVTGPESECGLEDFDPRSPLRSYFRVTRNLAVEPERFFRAVRGGGLWGPTLFAFATYLLVSLLSVVSFASLLVLFSPDTWAFAVTGPWSFWLIMAASLILTPFAGVLGVFVGALIWHPFVTPSVGIGRRAGFRETYRIGAYPSLPYVLGGLIPFVGPFLALGAMSYVGVFGVKGAHGANTARAIISVAVPLVLTFLLFIVMFVAFFALANDATP